MQPTQAPNETRLPRAVIRRSAALQERLDARNKPPESENTDPATPTDPATTPAVVVATPVDPPPKPAGDPRHSDPAYWQQRFEVTSGILTQERRERSAERDRLNQRATELQGQVETLKAQAPTPKIDVSQFFTEEQRAKYGDEQCEVMAQTAMRAARETAKGLVDAAMQPLKQERDDAQARERKTTTDAFQAQLTELFPAWADADKDPSWLAYLADLDENTGYARQDLLNQHIGRANARGCAAMLQAWTRSKAPAAAAASPTPAPTPTPPITPSGRGAAGGPDTSREVVPAGAKGYPTPAETKDFYKRSSTLRKGQPGFVTDAERVDFEARLRLRTPA